MAEFLIAAALCLLLVVAAGLARLLRGPSTADRIMAVQLLGTGGCAISLLLAIGMGYDAILDVALTLALLAAFAVAALGLSSRSAVKPDNAGGDHAG